MTDAGDEPGQGLTRGSRGDLRWRIAQTPLLMVAAALGFALVGERLQRSTEVSALYVWETYRLAWWVNIVGALFVSAVLVYVRRGSEDPAATERRFLRGVEWLAYGATVYSLVHIHVSGCFSTVMFGALFIPLAPAAWVLPWPRVIRLALFQLGGYVAVAALNASGALTYAPIFQPHAALDAIQGDLRMRAVMSASVVALYVVLLSFLRSFRVVLDRQATGLGGIVEEKTSELAQANRDVAERAASLRRAHYALDERNRELERERETLAELARAGALGQLAASIAHELNQPLGVIELRGAVAARALRAPVPKTGAVKTSLQAMGDAVERARGIVGALRRLHDEDEAHSDVIVGALVSDTVMLLEPVARRDGIALEATTPVGAIRVRGDASQLRQVVYNLVHNALQVLAEGAPSSRSAAPPRVSVSWRREGDDVVLDVDDNGPGVPEGIDVFAAFVSDRAGGLGVGLALCRTIVEQHRGSLEHGTSALGGARFTMRLPGEHARTPEEGDA